MYTQSFDVMGFLRDALALTDAGYRLFNAGSHLIAISIMLPATFMAGMTLPLLTNSLLRAGHGENAIGRIYAANTLGAIVGIALAINLLMPLLGVKGLIVAGGLVDIAAGCVLLMRFGPRGIAWRKYAIGVAGAFGEPLAATIPSHEESDESEDDDGKDRSCDQPEPDGLVRERVGDRTRLRAGSALLENQVEDDRRREQGKDGRHDHRTEPHDDIECRPQPRLDGPARSAV